MSYTMKRSNSYHLLIIYLLSLAWIGPNLSGQTILNGSFEQNDQDCGYNLTNNIFSQSMLNHQGFGSQNEIDIINSNCGYGDAAEGVDFVALYSNNGSDSLSLKLSAPLEPGLTYTLHFYDKNGQSGGISTGKTQIGLSHSPDTFGELLFTGPVTRFEWNIREVIFKPQQPYEYITATVTSTEEAWVFLDGFAFFCPEIDLGNDTALCKVEGVVLQTPPDFDRVSWNTGSREQSITVSSVGQYWAEGISGGCLVRDSVVFSEIENNCDCKIFVPNAFSPNGDGINDTFTPLAGCDVQDYELLIFNRWGELQFQTSDLTQAWTGEFRQSPAMEGTYFYWLHYRFAYSARPEIEKGEIVLIR